MLTFTKSELKKRIAENEILLSQEKKNPILFILHSGKIGFYHNIKLNDKEYNINFFDLTKEQYFGYESFIPNMHDIKFITEEEAIVSFFPVNDFQEIIDYKLELFPILMNDIFYKVKRYNLLLNQVITLANQLHQGSRHLAKILLELSVPIPGDAQLEPYFSNHTYNLPFNSTTIKNFFMVEENQEQKYREFVFKNDFFINDFLDHDVIDKFMRIVKAKKKTASALFEINFEEIDKYHMFLEKKVQDLVYEFGVFFARENSLLKLFKENEKKTNPKDSRFFFSLMNFFSKEIFENPILKSINLDKDQDSYLTLEIEDNSTNLDEGEKSAQADSDNSAQENQKYSSPDNESEIMKIYESNYKAKELAKEVILEIKKYNYQYINYYKYIYKKKAKEILTPIEEDFLNYGIYQNLLEKEQTATLKNIIDEEFSIKTKYDIILFSDWMDSIIDGTNLPSNNELAISYRKHLLNLERFKKKNEDPIEDKIEYEMSNAFMSIMNIFNRNSINLYPLNKINFPKDLTNQTITSTKLAGLLDEIRDKDFTLFFRETLFKYENKNHFIQYEVLPKFIIIPVISSKIVFWQEMVDNRKKTQARFFLPLFYNGNDLKKELITNLGAYRWEICRSVKGVNWMDPVDGALTGAFSDYMTFYKKNRSLSTEQKEKLYNMKKKYRDNKRLFIQMYYLWLEYESRGLVRLNDVEREMFCRQIPFKKKIRNTLSNVPIFQNYITRYNNLVQKEYDIITRKFKNFKKPDSDELLDEIQMHIDYCNS